MTKSWIVRKFQRFLYSAKSSSIISKSDTDQVKVIGTVIYDFEKQTETYVSTPKK